MNTWVHATSKRLVSAIWAPDVLARQKQKRYDLYYSAKTKWRLCYIKKKSSRFFFYIYFLLNTNNIITENKNIH